MYGNRTHRSNSFTFYDSYTCLRAIVVRKSQEVHIHIERKLRDLAAYLHKYSRNDD